MPSARRLTALTSAPSHEHSPYPDTNTSYDYPSPPLDPTLGGPSPPSQNPKRRRSGAAIEGRGEGGEESELSEPDEDESSEGEEAAGNDGDYVEGTDVDAGARGARKPKGTASKRGGAVVGRTAGRAKAARGGNSKTKGYIASLPPPISADGHGLSPMPTPGDGDDANPFDAAANTPTQEEEEAEYVSLASSNKPFPCEHPGCGKRFARRSDLVRHVRIHSNERPFICPYPVCPKSFIQRSALTVHIRVQFCRKTTLTKHIKRQHPAVDPSAYGAFDPNAPALNLTVPAGSPSDVNVDVPIDFSRDAWNSAYEGETGAYAHSGHGTTSTESGSTSPVFDTGSPTLSHGNPHAGGEFAQWDLAAHSASHSHLPVPNLAHLSIPSPVGGGGPESAGAGSDRRTSYGSATSSGAGYGSGEGEYPYAGAGQYGYDGRGRRASGSVSPVGGRGGNQQGELMTIDANGNTVPVYDWGALSSSGPSTPQRPLVLEVLLDMRLPREDRADLVWLEDMAVKKRTHEFVSDGGHAASPPSASVGRSARGFDAILSDEVGDGVGGRRGEDIFGKEGEEGMEHEF
ncbi:hypothetical protein MNV49_003264 [Pseudohyphozyma bogoriensis]|nr:hypothetical protein MNV49_003264 [Pseudohyphozyma bogoriensis]